MLDKTSANIRISEVICQHCSQQPPENLPELEVLNSHPRKLKSTCLTQQPCLTAGTADSRAHLSLRIPVCIAVSSITICFPAVNSEVTRERVSVSGHHKFSLIQQKSTSDFVSAKIHSTYFLSSGFIVTVQALYSL